MSLLDSKQSDYSTGSNFDATMAKLLAEATKINLSGSVSGIAEMVATLHSLLNHPDIEHYPHQQRVLIKMQHLWRTKLFRLQGQQTIH